MEMHDVHYVDIKSASLRRILEITNERCAASFKMAANKGIASEFLERRSVRIYMREHKLPRIERIHLHCQVYHTILEINLCQIAIPVSKCGLQDHLETMRRVKLWPNALGNEHWKV